MKDIIWDKIFKEQEWGKYPPEALIRFIANNFYLGDRKETKILEVGCGPGANIWYMAREGFDVYGIDGSPTAIERTRQRVEKEGLKANLQVGDIIKLPYKDNYFDAAIDNECLYSNPEKDSKIILSEIKRVLKKNGLFYSRTFTDGMYIGSSRRLSGDLEYENISDGPLAGTGFVRLVDRRGIHKLYGKFFNIISVDKLEYTCNNGTIKVSKWIIICKKKD